MIDITMQVQKLLQKRLPPERSAIIYKENKYGEELSAIFQAAKNSVLQQNETLIFLRFRLRKKLFLLLKYLAAEHDIPYSGDEMLV